MHVDLVVNAAAGGGTATRRLDAVRNELAAHATVAVHEPSSAAASETAIGDLAAAGAERVVVLGGDGMVHVAANALVGTDTALGIVAAGTGNDTAKALGLPAKVGEACSAAVGPTRRIDLIGVGDRVAVTVAIVGLAVAINERAERMRFPKGAAKYSLATLVELPRLRTHHLTVTVDGVEHDVSTNLLAVANLPYFGGGMKVAPDASPTDGALDVVSIGPANPLTIGALLPTIFPGRHVKNRRVTVLRGTEVTIEGEDLRMRADGEPLGSLPATLQARAGALTVAAP